MVSYGQWFSVHLVFNVVLMSIGVVLLLQELWRPAALARRQSIITLLSVVPPSIGSWTRIFQ